MDIKSLLENAVELFKNTEIKSFKDEDTEIKKAIKNALGDFTFRTAEKKNNNYKGGVDELFKLLCDDSKNSLERLFLEFFNNAPEDFDEWHNNTCECVLKKLRKKYKVHYGKAQKIVNMTFKYLYCSNEWSEECFECCHIPLDSIILDWIWDNKSVFNDYYSNLNLEKKFLKKYFDSWSNLKYDSGNIIVDEKNGKEYYSYMFYQRLIRKLCEGKGITPLQLEFLVWPQYQWEKAAKEFYKQTENMLKIDNDKSKKTANDLFDNINKLLDEKLDLVDWKSEFKDSQK